MATETNAITKEEFTAFKKDVGNMGLLQMDLQIKTWEMMTVLGEALAEISKDPENVAIMNQVKGMIAVYSKMLEEIQKKIKEQTA